MHAFYMHVKGSYSTLNSQLTYWKREIEGTLMDRINLNLSSTALQEVVKCKKKRVCKRVKGILNSI